MQVGDLVRDGGHVERLVKLPELCEKWEQAQWMDETQARVFFDMVKKHSENVAALTYARWDETAKAVGFKDLRDAQSQGYALTIQFATDEVAVIRQVK